MKITKDKVIFLIIASVILSIVSAVSTYATNYLFNSNEVSYNNTSSGLTSTDVQGAIDELYTEATNYTTLRNMIYQVGSIYISVEDDTVAKVEARFGGTWEAFGAGRTLVGVETGTDANSTSKTFAINETNGEYTHKLTIAEMPAHKHRIGWVITNNGSNKSAVYDSNSFLRVGLEESATYQSFSQQIGGNGYHNNIPPYITVYMYKRTA